MKLFFAFLLIYLNLFSQQDTLYTSLSFEELVDSLYSEVVDDSVQTHFQFLSSNVKDYMDIDLVGVECPAQIIIRPKNTHFRWTGHRGAAPKLGAALMLSICR